jgi:acetoin utilization protein AcuB
MPARKTIVATFMTPQPHSIGADQSLETAHAMMRAHGIRHLPVLARGKLVGLLSERDLLFVEALEDLDLRGVRVEQAMAQDIYAVAEDAPLEDVARTMAERKLGCAVVVDGAKVVGVFTAVDALRALVESLRRERPALR